jgi:hypothetical protein
LRPAKGERGIREDLCRLYGSLRDVYIVLLGGIFQVVLAHPLEISFEIQFDLLGHKAEERKGEKEKENMFHNKLRITNYELKKNTDDKDVKDNQRLYKYR